MDFMEYFGSAKRAQPRSGVRGVESDWLKFGPLNLPNGSLWVGDARVTDREEGMTTRLDPGRYDVQLKGMDFEGVRLISRVRLVPKPLKSIRLGERLGSVITDHATVGFCDIDALEAAVPAQFLEEYDKELGESISGGSSITGFTYGGGPAFYLAYVESGLGDGEFEVFGLHLKDKLIGVEVEFLPPGYVAER